MLQKILATFLSFFIALILLGCTGKKSSKKLTVPVGQAVADTLVRLDDTTACHVHVEFAYLKGEKYGTVNDSLLRMGLLQPDYFSISNERLVPEKAVREFVRRYIAEYRDMARLIRETEKGLSKLNWNLDIHTQFIPGKGNGIVCLSSIRLENSGVGPLTYVIARNFDPETGKLITMQNEFGNDYNKRLGEKIAEKLEDMDATTAFGGVKAYPTENFILTDDSLTFIYTPGELDSKERRITIEY